MSTEESQTLKELLEEQAADGKWQATTQTVRQPASCYSYHRDSILIRTAPIDGSPQKFVHITPRGDILWLFLHPALAGNPRKRRTYETIRQHFYCWDMASDVYILVNGCCSCAQKRSQATHRLKPQLFSAAEPLDLVAIHILLPLPLTTAGKQHVITIKSRLSKLT